MGNGEDLAVLPSLLLNAAVTKWHRLPFPGSLSVGLVLLITEALRYRLGFGPSLITDEAVFFLDALERETASLWFLTPLPHPYPPALCCSV